MAQDDNEHPFTTVGTWDDDKIDLDSADENPDLVNGNVGSDELITGDGNDLAAGDMVSKEWKFINGKWVYDPSELANTGSGPVRNFDDVIITGNGDDVLLGNGGNDILRAGRGDDLINAGTGADDAYGDDGDDIINLEAGNDYAEGGLGADIVNAGSGDDIVYGDLTEADLLEGNHEQLSSFSQFAGTGAWTMTDDGDGTSSIAQSAQTEIGKDYTISFDLAANLAGGHASGKVEVLWNGSVVDTVTVNSGIYETHEVVVTSTGEQGNLTFRAVPEESDVVYNFDGPITSYDKQIDFGDGSVDVAGFAPGQAKLYQMIDGALKVFDPQNGDYIDAGAPTGLRVNAVGFNVETDMLYGVAKANGVDSLGNAVAKTDIVAVDANGDAYRVGKGVYGDYVGDFDSDGNLWTFHSALNRVSVVDVDNLDANGDPQITTYDLPNGLFTDRTYDLAYNATDDCFYAVVAPSNNAGEGKVVRIDMSEVPNGGTPTFEEIPITDTLYEDGMRSGMSKGAYGAVFLDGDGNLYYGLNNGDHDLKSSTGTDGGIYKVNMDWEGGKAYSEFMSEAPATSSNDGAVDPRSSDAFAQIDADAAVLLRNPKLLDSEPEGGNDKLRGGQGDDEMYGNGGDDVLYGGQGNDTLSGDSGNDIVIGGDGDDTISGGSGVDALRGGTGNDIMDGGAGNDRLFAGSGDDIMSGGSGDDHMGGQDGADVMDGGDGNDLINGGTGADTLSGGAGSDKLIGGLGSDILEGGAGNDHMWGGKWTKDSATDTFVISGGGGKDMIHDFETSHDQIDLSSYGLDYSDLQAAMTDKGWALEIDLSGFNGGQEGDKLLIKAVNPDDLDESNFIL